MKLIRDHPEKGHAILARQEGMSTVLDVCLNHHERIDGKGYPRKLSHGEISLHARLAAFAMSMTRSLRHAPTSQRGARKRR